MRHLKFIWIFILGVIVLFYFIKKFKTEDDLFSETNAQNPKYSSGKSFVDNTHLKPKIFNFQDYTFIAGYGENGEASLGQFFGNNEIYYTQFEGFCDTIWCEKINNDNITDYFISISDEDGATLYSFTSSSTSKFVLNKVLDNWTSIYCSTSSDTLKYIIPFQIRDINKDSRPEIILNQVKIEEKIFSIQCTDTLYIK